MPRTFQEIMDYAPMNPQIFDDLKGQIRSGALIPFVGAGFSAPIYPTWSAMLREIAEKTEASVRGYVQKLLAPDYIAAHADALEEAANRLQEAWGPILFAEILKEKFTPERLGDPRSGALYPAMPATVLPGLFPGGLLLTTNYDQVLEHSYMLRGCNLLTCDVLHQEKITRWRREGGHRPLLVKLHGDVDEMETTAILSGESYDKAYRPGSELVRTLEDCYGAKSILFLGCSLQQDRTMVILESRMGPGMKNFTIYACGDTEQDKQNTARNFSQKRIFPILYPKSEHDCVRVILEELLYQTDPERYQQLPRKLREQNALKHGGPSRRLSPASNPGTFFGRNEELERLRRFCEPEAAPFSWWTVTGDAGIGKTRLALELQSIMRDNGWTVDYVESADDRALTMMDAFLRQNIGTNMLLVIDRYLGFEYQISKWLSSCARSYPGSFIRILLIERNNSRLDRIQKNVDLPEPYAPEPLLLAPLGKEDILRLIRSYGAPHLLPRQEEEIYRNLLAVDPAQQRPLYAIYLTEAHRYAPAEKVNTSNDLLKQILRIERARYSDYFENQFRGESPIRTESRVSSYLKLKLAASLVQVLNAEQIAGSFPRSWKLFCPEDLNDTILEDLEGRRDRIFTILPDLLAGFFLLSEWKADPAAVKEILERCWEINSFRCFQRLSLCARDFPEEAERLRESWDFRLSQETGEEQHSYALLLSSLAESGGEAVAEDSVRRLSALAEKADDEDFILPVVAAGLADLSIKSGTPEVSRRCLEKLKTLAVHPFCQEYYVNRAISALLRAPAQDSFRLIDQDLWGILSDQELLNPLFKYSFLFSYTNARIARYLQDALLSWQQVYRRHQDILSIVKRDAPGSTLCLPFLSCSMVLSANRFFQQPRERRKCRAYMENLYRGEILPLIAKIEADETDLPAVHTIFNFKDKGAELILKAAWNHMTAGMERAFGSEPLRQTAAYIRTLYHYMQAAFAAEMSFREQDDYIGKLRADYQKAASKPDQSMKEAYAAIYANGLACVYERRLRPIFKETRKISREDEEAFGAWESMIEALAGESPGEAITLPHMQILLYSTVWERDIGRLRRQCARLEHAYRASVKSTEKEELRRLYGEALTNYSRLACDHFIRGNMTYNIRISAMHTVRECISRQRDLFSECGDEEILCEIAKATNNLSLVAGSLEENHACGRDIVKLVEQYPALSQEHKDTMMLEYAKSLVQSCAFIRTEEEGAACAVELIDLYLLKAAEQSPLVDQFWLRLQKLMHGYSRKRFDYHDECQRWLSRCLSVPLPGRIELAKEMKEQFAKYK